MVVGPLGRIIAQVVVLGVSILARAVPAAYNAALQNAKKNGVNAAENGGTMLARRVMRRDEALQVLNLTEAEVTAEAVQRQYDRYFEANAVEKGGSFYLQSKIHRAKEQLDEFMKEKRMEEKQEQ